MTNITILLMADVLGRPPVFYAQALLAAFMAVLFLQSGFDKVLHYGGNLAYLREHFKTSPLAGLVGVLMPLITALELAAGAASACGLATLFLGNHELAWWGQLLAAKALLCLFIGQRLAKDYAGAASLVPYFLLAIAGMLLLGN